jgi:hypothetical protein
VLPLGVVIDGDTADLSSTTGLSSTADLSTAPEPPESAD